MLNGCANSFCVWVILRLHWLSCRADAAGESRCQRISYQMLSYFLEGTATLEISNTTPLPAKIYAHEGIAQVLFFQSDEPCAISYRDKKGKYQAQLDVTLPKI